MTDGEMMRCFVIWSLPGQRRYVCPSAPAEWMPKKPSVTRNREDYRPLVLPEAAQQTAMSPSLSRREIEVLQHVAVGETSKEIARALGIAERTVNWHIERAFVKLRAGSRAEAVALAIETGVLRRPHDSRTEP